MAIDCGQRKAKGPDSIGVVIHKVHVHNPRSRDASEIARKQPNSAHAVTHLPIACKSDLLSPTYPEPRDDCHAEHDEQCRESKIGEARSHIRRCPRNLRKSPPNFHCVDRAGCGSRSLRDPETDYYLSLLGNNVSRCAREPSSAAIENAAGIPRPANHSANWSR